MKSIIIFYDNKSKYSDEAVFGDKTAKQLAQAWADSLKASVCKVFEFNSESCPTLQLFLEKSKAVADSEGASNIIFAFKDCPFLNKEITEKLLSSHIEYKAEYTFADGYPNGFAPEVLDAGTCGILAELGKGVQSELGSKGVTREGLFELIKTDINSFEVETILAPEDWRLLRYNFDCSKKENFIACKELYKASDGCKDIAELSKIAASNVNILKTVPGYYSFQLAEKCSGTCSYCPYPKCYEAKNKAKVSCASKLMDFNKFSKLIDKIADLSENAVIGLSAWGESFNHPDLLKFIEKVLSFSGLSVFIETDGNLVTETFCEGLKNIVEKADERTNGWQKIMFAVSLDAFTAQTYTKIHGNGSVFEKTVDAVKMLEAVCPGSVYPQLVRMNENEEELEAFFRYWNEKTNVTKGNFIIQQYNNYCGLLPESKPADLSPIDRNVCWHLRRDMTILCDGSVPFCACHVLDGIIGNVFEEDLETVWHRTDSAVKDHLCQKYNDKCKDCDEFYTYFF